MSNLLKTLHAYEIEVLKLLIGESTVKELASESNLQEIQIKRAVQWLSNKGLIEANLINEKKIILGKNGLLYKEKSLPEIRFLKALSDDFNVISVISPKGKLESYYEGTTHRYAMVEKSSNLMMLVAAKKLAKIIDENSVDVLHLHWTKDIPIAVLAKKLSKSHPKLVQTRNMNMTRFKDDFYHRLLYKNIEMMLPVTKRVAEQIERYIPENIRPRVEVLYMGTPVPELLSEKERESFRRKQQISDTFGVGIVGRIEESKGQHLLIEVLSKLEGVSAYFVGHEMQEGYMETLKAQAKSLGIAERVHFLGFMNNPAHFMQACDALVLATPCETFGLVVIEAMAVETAMIATKACGPLEIIEDGVSGMLFESMDAESLQEKVTFLKEDAVRRKKIAKAGKVRVENTFLDRTQFQKLSELLRSL